MTIKVFTDRTRIIEKQRCGMRRWLGYHEQGTGITSRKTPLPLCVGGAVHSGLEVLLREGQSIWQEFQSNGWDTPDKFPEIEEHAVAAALAEFRLRAQDGAGLELDASEQAAMQPTAEAIWQTGQMHAQARELGMSTEGLGLDREQSKSEFDRYLYAEQSALVEGLVRAYARRRLRPLLEQFEVLEVEREGEWKMAEWGSHAYCHTCDEGFDYKMEDGGFPACKRCKCDDSNMSWHNVPTTELWFMSRPDALLRERSTNELYLLSYKTAAGWDVRKARDIERDMQGLSEGVEVERRLGEWWQQIQDIRQHANDTRKLATLGKEVVRPDVVGESMYRYLCELPAPPRIHAIRYEFLLKGERWEDKELSARMGMTVRSQRSHLVRQYVATSTPARGEAGYRVGDVCWAWEFYRPEDDKESKLAWQNWHLRPVWDYGTYTNYSEVNGVKAWIDALDQSELLMSGEDSTIGLEPRVLGWKSRAQALGVTRQHPLDSVFVPPVTVYRGEDDLRDWYDSTSAQERQVAEAVAQIEAASDDGERRHLLNVHFPMYRHSCSYPSECQFVGVCFGPPEAKADPMSMGKFQARQANHPQELVSVTTNKHNP